MKPDTKILLDIYSKEFKDYKNFIDSNYWHDDVYYNIKKGKLESSKLNTEVSIIDTILTTTKKFKEDVGEDIENKKVKDFIKYTTNIINKHIDDISLYKKNNPLGTNEDIENQESEVEFHSYLFSLITKTKVALSKLQIDEEELSKKSIDIFHSNMKAPLAMREYLCEEFPIIKQKTDNIGLNFSVPHINPATSNEMLINMKEKDIPKWDTNKHFFEQEKSTIQFWEEEFKKIKNGINIGGYHLSGWLYWDQNIFKFAYGSGEDKGIKVAEFRDNEFFFDHMYNLAGSDEYGRHAVFMYGTRRFSKSRGMTSRLLHGMWTIKNAQGTVQGFSKVPDLEAILTYAGDCIQNIYPALRIPANNLDFNDGIILGLKGKKVQDRYDCAKLSIINLEGGNTKKGGQKTAGSTPDVFLLDEAGKGAALTPWKAAMPSFAGGKNGKWRLTPLISGCVCAGTKVYNHKGELKNIEELLQKEGILGYSKNEGIVSKEPITWMQPPSEKLCYRITTRKKHVLECSYEHPILVRHRNLTEKIDGKWVRKIEFIPTEDLKVGQQICIAESVDIWGNNKMWEPRLVGWFIGDGYYAENEVPTISSCDPEINDYISNKFETSNKKKPELTKEGKIFLQRRLKGTAKYLKELGIYGQTHCDKTLPYNIYSYCKEDICEMLGGLFDTDGFATYKSSSPNIGFTSKCESLVIEVRNLLNKLGIHPTYNLKTHEPNELVKIKTTSYTLTISDKRSIYTFYKNIKFKIKYKQNNLERIIEFLHKKKEQIPSELKNMRLDTISSIECIGVKPVYNLTAGKTNTYLANNIITHNTAGEGELSKDAELMLKNPELYNILPMDWDTLEAFVDPENVTWKRNKFGFFVPAQLSIEGPDKYDIGFGDFLNNSKLDTSNYNIDDLNKISIKATDWAAQKEFFNEKREKLSKDINLLAGETNSFPLDPEDCYLTTEINIFPGLEAKSRKKNIEDTGEVGEKYRLFKVNGNISFEMVPNEKIITEYPYKGGSFDAPVVMLENPLLLPNKPPLGLYCMGLDDIKHDKSDGDSLLSCTIYKRSYEGGEWADRFVAWYDTRPERKEDAYKVLYCMMKAFNARVLHENADNGFLEWVEKNYMDDVYIHFSDSVGLASEENLHRNQNRKFGWAPTGANIYRLNQKMVMYTKRNNVVVQEKTDLTGIDTINHPMLLEELYRYKKDQNADRIRSAGLALTLAEYYDKTFQYIKKRRNDVVKNDGMTKYEKNVRNNRTSYGGLIYDKRLR